MIQNFIATSTCKQLYAQTEIPILHNGDSLPGEVPDGNSAGNDKLVASKNEL